MKVSAKTDCRFDISVFFLRIVAPVKIDFGHFLKMLCCCHENRSKVYKMKVLKAWDYARMIFESEKLRIAYIKAEIGTGKPIF